MYYSIRSYVVFARCLYTYSHFPIMYDAAVDTLYTSRLYVMPMYLQSSETRISRLDWIFQVYIICTYNRTTRFGMSMALHSRADTSSTACLFM